MESTCQKWSLISFASGPRFLYPYSMPKRETLEVLKYRDFFLEEGGTVSNAFMAFPTPAIGALNSLDSQKEKEKHAGATCGSHSPFSFFTLLLPNQPYPSFLGGAAHKEAHVGDLWSPINLKYLCDSNSSKLFPPIPGQNGPYSAERNKHAEKEVPLHKLDLKYTCNQYRMPQVTPGDKYTPFHI